MKLAKNILWERLKRPVFRCSERTALWDRPASWKPKEKNLKDSAGSQLCKRHRKGRGCQREPAGCDNEVTHLPHCSEQFHVGGKRWAQTSFQRPARMWTWWPWIALLFQELARDLQRKTGLGHSGKQWNWRGSDKWDWRRLDWDVGTRHYK